MPGASLELMHSFLAALDRHDEATLLELVHPEAQFASLIQEVEGTFRGHDGLRAYLSNLFASFPDWRVEVEQTTRAGATTVVRVRARATGLSGVSIDLCDWLAMTARGGKAAWWAFFRTESEALEAARSAAQDAA
jgi:SnoaL-like domain